MDPFLNQASKHNFLNSNLIQKIQKQIDSHQTPQKKLKRLKMKLIMCMIPMRHNNPKKSKLKGDFSSKGLLNEKSVFEDFTSKGYAVFVLERAKTQLKTTRTMTKF